MCYGIPREMRERQHSETRHTARDPECTSGVTHNCCFPTSHPPYWRIPSFNHDTSPSHSRTTPPPHALTMLDDFSIVTTSGIVLWRRSYAPVSTNVVNSLINDVFVEERQKSGAQETAVNPPYKKDKYTVKWTAAKDVGLVFVVGKSTCDSIPKS